MLDKLEELLKALKAQSILPSIKTKTAPSPKVAAAKPIKLPGLTPTNQKNPVKQAEQTQNKDIKDMKMREAQEKLAINKSSGQWSLEDEGYQGVKGS